MHLLSHMALPNTATSAPLRKISGTCHATAGTRTTIAHGLVNESGKPQVPVIVAIHPTGVGDADGAVTPPGVYEIPALRTATSIVVRGTVTLAPFDAYVG